MTLRRVSVGLVLLALTCTVGCNCGKCFNRSTSACPPAPVAVGGAPCCPDPTPAVPIPTPAPGVAVQPGF